MCLAKLSSVNIVSCFYKTAHFYCLINNENVVKNLAFIFFLVFSNLGFGQNTCIVSIKDMQTKEPIPYVHLYNNYIGVISNEFGKAELTSVCADSLVVSSIGYMDKVLMFSGSDTCLYLKPKAYILDEIKVSPKKYTKSIRLGVYGREVRRTRYRACKGLKGYSTVLFFDGIHSKNTLSEISFFVASKSKGNNKLRLRILDSNDGAPNEDLCTESIIFDINKEKGWQTLNLRSFDIILPSHPFFVGIEFLGDKFGSNSSLCLGLTPKYKNKNRTWVKNIGGFWHQLAFMKGKRGKQLNLMINILIETYRD